MFFRMSFSSYVRLTLGLALIFSVNLAVASESTSGPIQLRVSNPSSAPDKKVHCIDAEVFQDRLSKITYKQSKLRERLSKAYLTASSHAPRELLTQLKKSLTEKHNLLWNEPICDISKELARARMAERNQLQNEIARVHSEAALQRLRRK
ncbi:MAG: hypothetical protein CMH54_11635 [Myxococcales bacterium]|nr:hypothetical protein [Myxococcales bacterium]